MGNQTKKTTSGGGQVETPPILKAASRIKNTDDAKQLLSKLISEFCKGRIENQQAKTLCYLLSQYVAITKDSDFEKRLEALEEAANNDKS